MNPTRRMLVFSTGGLCNALDSVIAASYLAEHLKCKMQLYWIEGYIANDIHISDIFTLRADAAESTELVDETYFQQFLMDHTADSLAVLAHMKLPELGGLPSKNPKDFGHVHEVVEWANQPLNRGKDLFLITDELPQWITNSYMLSLKSFFKRFDMRREYLDAALNFIKKHPGLEAGAHIRGTDLLSVSGTTIEHIKQFAQSLLDTYSADPTCPIFICSDDEQVERTLKEMSPRFVMHPDKDYVRRRDVNASWFHEASNDHLTCDRTIEYGDKTYKNYSSINVVRSKKQILGGWIDLLTLAHMKHIHGFITSRNSTYFLMARLLHHYMTNGGQL
jgi:hypothetical protein